MPGRLRTASSPSRTWIAEASYAGGSELVAGAFSCGHGPSFVWVASPGHGTTKVAPLRPVPGNDLDREVYPLTAPIRSVAPWNPRTIAGK